MKPAFQFGDVVKSVDCIGYWCGLVGVVLRYDHYRYWVYIRDPFPAGVPSSECVNPTDFAEDQLELVSASCLPKQNT